MSVISAIIAAIKAVPIIDGWFSQLVTAWISSQAASTQSAIIDAAAAGAHATTDEERYIAAALWQKALQRPRITT